MVKAVVARDFMVSRLVTLAPEMDVFHAVKLLLKHRISGAPVVDREGHYLGVFSEKCSMHVLLDAAYDSLPATTVGAFMDSEARTIGLETDLLAIAQVFLLTSARRLPVVDEQGLLRGQISRRDVLSAAFHQLDPHPVRESSFLYLSAVTERSSAPVS
jgi:CBS domain-containing protein